MSHSPYGRNPKTEPSPPPRGKTTTPEEARAANAATEPDAVGQEPGPFRVDSIEEGALIVAARDVAESFGLEPSAVALGAARVLYALADANRLSAELSGLVKDTSPEFKEAYAAQLDQAARVWLERRSEPKKKGRGKTKPVNPDAGHGAADGFGGSDFPPTMPGPDEGRPQ